MAAFRFLLKTNLKISIEPIFKCIARQQTLQTTARLLRASVAVDASRVTRLVERKTEFFEERRREEEKENSFNEPLLNKNYYHRQMELTWQCRRNAEEPALQAPKIGGRKRFKLLKIQKYLKTNREPNVPQLTWLPKWLAIFGRGNDFAESADSFLEGKKLNFSGRLLRSNNSGA